MVEHLFIYFQVLGQTSIVIVYPTSAWQRKSGATMTCSATESSSYTIDKPSLLSEIKSAYFFSNKIMLVRLITESLNLLVWRISRRVFNFVLMKRVYLERCLNTFACSCQSHLFKFGVTSCKNSSQWCI